MHPLYGALSVLCEAVWVALRALVARLYTYRPTCCRTSQCHMTIILLSVFQWNNLGDPVFDGVELAGFWCKSNASLLN